MSTIAIRAEQLSKRYRIGARQEHYRTLRDSLAGALSSPLRRLASTFRNRKTRPEREAAVWALDHVDFEVYSGEVVGIIGRNGAGKSTLLKVLSRITEPTSGCAEIHGRVGSLLEVGTGFHNELTGRENIYLNGAILGMRRAEIDRQFDAIVAFSEVEKFVDTAVKHYSTGMYLRLAFAVAAHLEPEILLVDEVLAVGDVAFQKKCLGKMGEVARQGRTVLFVSHNMGAVRSLCEKGIVLDRGRVVQSGDIGASIEAYYRLMAASEQTAAERVPSDGLGFGPVWMPGRNSSTIDQTEGFEVATTLHVGPGVAGFTLLCLMEDMNQRPILHLRRESTDLRRDGGLWEGAHEIRLSVPVLWLEPGLYSLHFKVLFWGQMKSARRLSDIFHIDVGGECSGWGAALSPSAQWSLEPAAAAAARTE